MKTTKIPPYIRSSNIELARWQSAVAATVRKRIKADNKTANFRQIHSATLVDPMVLGTNLHVLGQKNKTTKLSLNDVIPFLKSKGKKLENDARVHCYLSQYYFEAARDLKAGRIEALPGSPPGFPDSDYATSEWIAAGVEWTLYANPEVSPYIDWLATGNDIDTFSVVTIPENSTIAIIGDFGTGLPDATALLIALIQNQKPDIIIHVGDVYYSGTGDECEAYTQAFASAFTATGVTLPVFSIPGNHEYYSGGEPFFTQVMTMNASNNLSGYEQAASYFCLRTTDNNWQFLAMDTGYNSIHVDTAIDLASVAYAPWLEFNEAQWHTNKLQNFSGKTVLLSHHQLYSASAEINNGEEVVYMTGTNKSALTYLNGNLYNVFSPYLANVSAWFWGHEHILGIFADNQAGLKKGRLIGDSGYEEWQGQSPYTTSGSTYQYSSPNQPVEADTSTVNWNGTNYNFYQHAYAVIQLNGTSATVNYYEYEAMSPDATIPPLNQLPPPGQINFSDTL